ncbi:S41 family peptidase [Sphingomonas lenta]|uniref:Peptidase S41 n=1 Tax=Sphingomonas lenta TaxID=1141887 RepID=A0A2A2SD81_9SPHN|nr:S41 family peptidase [Sphingomonas lenta]PAX07173.1 peptidase S41 [Sphingomonas lenta]
MKRSRSVSFLALLAVLTGCGGGGGGGSSTTTVAAAPAPAPTPAPSSTCSLRDRQDWAAAQLREWYLFPETLPASLDPSGYADVNDYVDALTATARSQRRDRFFTYVTSIREENAFFEQGSSAGFGVRLSYDTAGRRLVVSEAFEGTPALAAGIDRGTEILAIGTSSADLRSVADLFASGGPNAVSNALGPSTAGTARLLRVADASGTRDVTVAKADFALTPVSSRYGARILNDGGRQVGYLNLRTFIDTADGQLRNAFATFRAAGVTEVIVDFRYNGGGLVSIAELMGDLLGANRTSADVFSITAFRPEKSQFNETRFFSPQPQSIAPTKIAFIGTGSTASASELVINSFVPYLGQNVALVGTNTFGKPVGQIARDRAQCDDRLRVVAFATQNRDRQGNYYDGLATTVRATCRAGDDLNFPLGDPREASVRAALDFLGGRPCSTIASAAREASVQAVGQGRRELLTPERPSVVQREVPGAF